MFLINVVLWELNMRNVVFYFVEYMRNLNLVVFGTIHVYDVSYYFVL